MLVMVPIPSIFIVICSILGVIPPAFSSKSISSLTRMATPPPLLFFLSLFTILYPGKALLCCHTSCIQTTVGPVVLRKSSILSWFFSRLLTFMLTMLFPVAILVRLCSSIYPLYVILRISTFFWNSSSSSMSFCSSSHFFRSWSWLGLPMAGPLLPPFSTVEG